MLLIFFKNYFIQFLLFVITLATTTLAGADWIGIKYDNFWDSFSNGLWFSIPFLGILTFHEFGHYFTAKWYHIKVTLPYYIPMYIPFSPTIGTMGAFIKIKSMLPSKKVVFDVGIAGPLAGFVVALFVLWYGFTHLPAPEHIYKVHHGYEQYGLDYDKIVYTYDYLRAEDSVYTTKAGVKFEPQAQYQLLSVGNNIFFYLCEKYFVDSPQLIPNKYEFFHYPFLFAGYLALFFTALNLLPIGQLDGGHILYGLIGEKNHRKVVPWLFGVFVYLGTIEFFNEAFDLHPLRNFDDMITFAPLYLLFLTIVFSSLSNSFVTKLMVACIIFALQYFTLYFFPAFEGFSGWWVFALLVGRFLGIYHPPSPDESPLNLTRKILGWAALAIFVLCFTPQPLVIEYVSK